ncbi:MAG: hypothetical protein OHK0029_28390 [Armatimonadaceae bacterium]
MARVNNNRSNDNNGAEIKVLYIEAKNINSDLSGVAQAIASAFRPSTPPQVSGNGAPRQVEGKGAKDSDGQTSINFSDDSDVFDGEVTAETPKKERAVRERKPFKGEIDDTISWDGDGVPFVDYVRQRNPQDTMKKYLVIATWFKRHGGHEAVDANLMYNAYRKMGWTGMKDMGQALRSGAKPDRGYFKRDIHEGNGFYAITNIGMDAADKVGNDKLGGDLQ